ncbi:hypothetical protein HDU79_002071, partial [Rhizoclosmatium sp. JEL0117]
MLGVCYESGHGVPKENDTALSWYQKAAEKGDEEAKDKYTALSSDQKAAEKGDEEAKDKLSVTGVEPFSAGHGKTGEAWERVATNVNTAMGLHNDADVKATGKNAFKRFKELLKKFKADEMESLRASGTEEEFEEREQLLSDLRDL